MSLDIGGREVDATSPAYLIAEIGSNHDGDLGTAEALVIACAEAGADAVKFQSFTADGLTRCGEASHPIVAELAVPDSWYPRLCEVSREVGVDFLSTPFEERLATLLASMGVPAFKIASGDLTHTPLLEHVARIGRPVLLSTGLSELSEIALAVETIQSVGNEQIAILHCVAAYPARVEDANLRAITTLSGRFGLPVGLSDHTPGHLTVLGARALGAVIFEKHVTFDRSLSGPDHGYALTITEFAELVRNVRLLETAMGDGTKRPCQAELASVIPARRSVHAARALSRGQTITRSDLKVVRPAEGIAPDEFQRVIGRVVCEDIGADEPIHWAQLE